MLHSRHYRFMVDNATLNQVLDGSGIDLPNVIETQGMPTTLSATQDALLVLALGETPVFIGPIRFQVDPRVLSADRRCRSTRMPSSRWSEPGFLPPSARRRALG